MARRQSGVFRLTTIHLRRARRRLCSEGEERATCWEQPIRERVEVTNQWPVPLQFNSGSVDEPYCSFLISFYCCDCDYLSNVGNY